MAHDLPRILEIERLCFASPWSLDAFKRELSLPFSKVAIAAAGGDADVQAGGFLCRWLIADECHVLNIAVHPAMRRHGIGTLLLGAVIEEAKATGAELVTLEVRRSNLLARQLYRKFAFEERRLRRHYYGPGEDAIVMELRFG
ncbi:MAG: ribosomal protein S18-alanine N-acetyltransferase [Candidatus Binataceae bacterium]